ncbi:MAG: hypothetical protein V3R99_05965 [Thermoguttaceae bacterium]
MAQEPTVIYTARTVQDAHLLKNLLAERQIEAIVLNEVLQGGSGVDIVGWSTAARVAVAEEHAVVARQMAVRFDHKQPLTDDDSDENILDEWPRCPECDARRSTQCPICSTAGTEFPPVDMGFDWIPQPGDLAGMTGSHCGPDGCTSGDPESEPPPLDDEASPPTMLMCTTCDEPFVPAYPRLCESCGHDFGDGIEVELPERPPEPIGHRPVLVMIALGVLLTVVLGYFMFVI